MQFYLQKFIYNSFICAFLQFSVVIACCLCSQFKAWLSSQLDSDKIFLSHTNQLTHAIRNTKLMVHIRCVVPRLVCIPVITRTFKLKLEYSLTSFIFSFANVAEWSNLIQRVTNFLPWSGKTSHGFSSIIEFPLSKYLIWKEVVLISSKALSNLLIEMWDKSLTSRGEKFFRKLFFYFIQYSIRRKNLTRIRSSATSAESV